MLKRLLMPALSLLILVPGHVASGPYGGARPVARPAPVVAHTPAFSAPRPAAPIARPVAPAAVRPAFAPQARPANINANVNRTAIGVGNRTTINSPTTINRTTINNPTITTRSPVVSGNVNRTVNVNNRALVNGHVNVGRANGYYRPGYAYYHNYYAGWHHGYWNSWNYHPWFWGGVGLTTGLILGAASPTAIYADPYYDAPPPTVVQVFDYSQPIPVPAPAPVLVDAPPADATPPAGPVTVASAPPAPPPPEAPSDENSKAATAQLDAARDAFMKKDYEQAQQAIDQAVRLMPSDATLHEFRALVLFARKQYREAAAVIHAVLAVGPGWDWETLKTLYPDTATYTQQLRELEAYCTANPTAASARFLLAYQYLVLDARDAAIKMLKSVVTLMPTDELAAYLLKSLEQPAAMDRPVPGT
jgi:tetratricopeptide (TPR) repeat protein